MSDSEGASEVVANLQPSFDDNGGNSGTAGSYSQDSPSSTLEGPESDSGSRRRLIFNTQQSFALWTVDENEDEQYDEEYERQESEKRIKRQLVDAHDKSQSDDSFRVKMAMTTGAGLAGTPRRKRLNLWRTTNDKIRTINRVHAALTTGLKAQLNGVNESRVATGELLVEAANEVEVEETRKEEEERKKKTWSIVRGIRSIFSMLSGTNKVSPVTITTQERPEVRMSLASKDKTEEEVLTENMGQTLKKQGLKMANEVEEYVPLQHQVDLAFETKEVRMQRVLLQRSPKIKEAVLAWWVELGMSQRKRGAGKTNKAALKRMKAVANKVAFIGGFVSFTKSFTASFSKNKAKETAEMPTEAPKTPSHLKFAKAVQNVKASNQATAGGALAMMRKLTGAKAKDNRTDGFMEKADYMLMCRELYIILGQDAMSERQAKNAAADDWKKDSRGMVRMNFSSFFDAVFELADLYTFSVNEEDYCRFLYATLERMEKPIVI